MNVYWFDVHVAGPVAAEHVEALGDRLAAGDGIDATVQADHRGGTVMFSRAADDAVQAIVSAIEDVEAVGMIAVTVAEDRLVVDEIADRAGVTTTAVRHWISGSRGPGGFPEPKVSRARGSLYSWAEVSAWLSAAQLGRVDHRAVEIARAAALIQNVLAVRRGIQELPRHDRPFVSKLVA